MTIESSVKNKVIEMHLKGKKRNEIAYDLNLSGIKISTGSISNIISEWRQRESQSTDEISTKVKSLTTTSTSTSAPSEGLPNPSTSLSIKDVKFSGQKNFAKGGPLCHFLQTEVHKQRVEEQEDSIVEEEMEPQINLEMDWDSIGVDKKVKVNSDKSLPTFVKTAAAQPEQKELVANVEAPEDLSLEPVPEADRTVPGPRSIEGILEREKVAWDYYGPAWMRILSQIRKEKDQRRHELLLIDRRKSKLEEWRKRLEQTESNLKDRESRLFEAEPFLAVAKTLKNLGIGMEEALPWIETIRETAEAENVDIRTTGINVAQELRVYRQSGAIQKQIESEKQELALIEMTTIQKKQAMTLLTDLLNRGITESQIVQLIDFASEWDRYWHSSTTTLQQSPPNANNGNDGAGGQKRPNRNGGNFSTNDLIRLNLLKTITTNMLNRMGPIGPYS